MRTTFIAISMLFLSMSALADNNVPNQHELYEQIIVNAITEAQH